MKKIHFQVLAIVTLIALIPTTGCVTHTTVKNEPRQNISFASAQAAQIFYDAYLKTYYPTHQTNSQTCFYVPWPWPYSHHHVTTDNVRFNTAIRSADDNKDGIISEGEATWLRRRSELFEQAK